MASTEIQQPAPVTPPAAGPPDAADYDELSAVVAARVRDAEFRERRLARTRPIHWPFMLARILTDVALLNIAFLLAYWARYNAQFVLDVAPEYRRTLGEMGVLQLYFTGLAVV